MVIKRLADQIEFLMNENTELRTFDQKVRNYNYCLCISSENPFSSLKSFKTKAECEKFKEEIEKAYKSGKEIFEF